ncbi:DUF4232 domain-containing protein [Nocardia sp. ET3-3]|uniref:DUF4232 domain-containing protein n=1 Tax=Nocardia terrae TaxID=2675851 RepID=A0A7K1V1A1_9NOCA|nr:DUF4232 domain-containing protein [Nocardia terrae]MVU80354.1 DUF4232 domain-containing protein [Nocardia terrae]
MRTTGFTALLACAVVAAASGCASSTSPGPTQSGSPAATTTAGSQSGGGNSGGNSGGGGSPATTPTDTTLAACAPGQVDVTAKSMGAAMSHDGITLTFSIANPSQSCTLTGYPGMDEITDTGTVIHAERTLNGYVGGLPQGTTTPPTVVVKSGHPAHAIAEGTSCGPYGKPDPKVVKTEVTPPNSTDTRVIDAAVYTCTLKIHPVTE